MAAKRTNSVFTSAGWVKKSESDTAKYDNMGEGFPLLMSLFRWFPDFLMDIFLDEDADYDLTWMQRMFIRAKARHQYCDITACRGATKSYCSNIEEYAELLLYPNTSCAYFAPNHRQGAKIGSQTFRQIEKSYPSFIQHFTLEAESHDRFEITTQFGSKFSIASFRGNNVHKVCAEEYAQEGQNAFNYEDYKRIVLPSVRLQYMVRGKKDPTYIRFKQHTITSAGRRQNHAYETRCRHYAMMERGESSFVIDVPYSVLLLNQMRPVQWAQSIKEELTPDEWAREMESRYTGTDENPMVSDSTLSESRSLLAMEEHTCLIDKDNRLSQSDVLYIIGYDVSYADGVNNAKCACVVLKCTKQDAWLKRDKYLKQVVWVDDWSPKNAMEQAKHLKAIWHRYCYEGNTALIAIDAWQYGTAVIQSLMMDLHDGLQPLSTMGRVMYTEYELEDCLPVIYPIKAGGVGVTDPDTEMVRYAQTQFEYRNVQMLTSNHADGIETYKKAHRIKDDKYDYVIYQPYRKTQELVGQIQNLKVINGAEKRISKHIQRDSWSALKYALRLAQKMERENLVKGTKKSAWDAEFNKYSNGNVDGMVYSIGNSRSFGRVGGRHF